MDLPIICEIKNRQKDAEQWYAADPKQRCFTNNLGRLPWFIAANYHGRFNCLGKSGEKSGDTILINY